MKLSFPKVTFFLLCFLLISGADSSPQERGDWCGSGLELPHLIGIDDDLLSTGIILYHLKVETA